MRMRSWSLVFAWVLAAPVWAQDAGPVLDAVKLAVVRQRTTEVRYSDVLDLGLTAVGPIRTKLLSDDDESIRIVGAMLLARIADNTQSLEAVPALEQCWADSSAGVSYWGARGLLAIRKLPAERAEELVLECISAKRPQPVRMVGCVASEQRKVKKAVGGLVAVLTRLAPAYADAKTQIFVEETETKEEAPYGHEPTKPKTDRKPIDLQKTRVKVIEEQGGELERHPAVCEVRAAGTALEGLVNEKFGFKEEPSWMLGVCLVRAREWYEANKAQYPAPGEEKKGAAEDAPKEKEKPKAKEAPTPGTPPQPAPAGAPAPAAPGIPAPPRGGALR